MRRQPRQARSQARVNHILDVAEALFARQGYGATTTNAIARQANVPIGSLYQFFPDKMAILHALAQRYGDQLHEKLAAIDAAAGSDVPLATYVNDLIDATDQFFTDHPSYHAIFMEAQITARELDTLDAATDVQLIEALSQSLAQRYPQVATADCGTIALVLVKAIGTLLWLALSQDTTLRQQLVAETKRLALGYLQSYCSADISPDSEGNAP